MGHRDHARVVNEEQRVSRDLERKAISVAIWEDTDVSDIDCTPTYDTSALNEKIRTAQLKCQSNEILKTIPNEQLLHTGGADSEVMHTSLFIETAAALRAKHHIDILRIAKSACLEMDVPIRSWVDRYMPSALRKPEDATNEVLVTRAASNSASRTSQNFGPEMMRGEGEAMAAFVASGQRIPRRGEVGWTPEDIERFERSGFVMSGSRNRRITNVRIRKEAQVYSAEQQRALSLYNYEQRAQHERAVAEELHALLKKGQTVEDSSDGPQH